MQLLLALILAATATTAYAQNEEKGIIVKSPIRENVNSLPVTKEVDGTKCAVIEVVTNDTILDVRPNGRAVAVEKRPGKIRIWVMPDETGWLELSFPGLDPQRLDIRSIRLKSERTYVIEVTVVVNEETYPFYASAGFNILSIMGPSLSVGYQFGKFSVEGGAVLGFNESENLYFYNSDGSLASAFSYKAIRAQLRAGYDLDFKGARFLKLTPQAGLAYTHISGTAVSGVAGSKKDYNKSLGAVSALAALRLKFSINSHWSVYVTPEFDFALGKSDELKQVGDADSKVKAWTDGFNLNAGLIWNIF